jgi:hypothetical protein
MAHAHLPSMHGSEEGSPWLLLPGVAVALAAVIAIVIVASFLIAFAVAGNAY